MTEDTWLKAWILYIAVLVITLISSCSPARRIERICERHPAVCSGKDTTIIMGDTVIIRPRILQDTVTIHDRDTVTITKDRVITKIIRRVDTFQVETICPGDTVIVTDTITVQASRVITSSASREKWWHVPLIAVLALVLVLKMVKDIMRG